MTSACLACQGRCCTTYIVPLTGHDVWRIMRAQQLAPSAFVAREPEAYPSQWSFRLRSNGPTFGLALRHRDARHNDRPCVFLMQLREGVQRCGIYPDRPRACRTYPIQLRPDGVAARDDMLCPPGSWSGLNADRERWREQLALQDQEWHVYAQVVGAWNSAVADQPAEKGYVLASYLEYLVACYDAIEQAGAPQEPALAALAIAWTGAP